MASMLQSVGQTVGWRSHRILEDFDENDSPVPDKFRKIPSSSSLNTLRMSLRKRMPLKPVQVNISENPTWESLEFKDKQRPFQTMRRTAKNAFGNVSQKMQKTCQSQSKYLVASPVKGKTVGPRKSVTSSGEKQSSSPQTPCRRSSKAISATTPKSVSRSTPKTNNRVSPQSGSTKKQNNSERKEWRSFSRWVGKDGLSLRRSTRTAALKSPYSSPTPVSRRRQFDRDLETVSTGIRQLRRLSQVFDEVIDRDEREEAIAHDHRLMARNVQYLQRSRTLSRRSLRKGAKRLGRTVGTWTELALNSITSLGAH
ncbi:protein PIMREG isoform X1 [Pleurodeles waltl]